MLVVGADGGSSIAAAHGPGAGVFQLRGSPGPLLPTLNAAMATEDGRWCGQPADPHPFASIYGDCDRWIGLTTLGEVLEGTGTDARVLPAPVGAASFLLAEGGYAVVSGSRAVAAWDGRGWTRLAGVDGDAPLIDVAGGPDGLVVWTVRGDRACRLAGGRSRCEAVPPLDVLCFGDLAGFAEHAWTLIEEELLHVVPGRPVERVGAEVIWAAKGDDPPVGYLPGGPVCDGAGDGVEAIAADTERGILWATPGPSSRIWPDAELWALHPDTGRVLGCWRMSLPDLAYPARLRLHVGASGDLWVVGFEGVRRVRLDPPLHAP